MGYDFRINNVLILPIYLRVISNIDQAFLN